VILLKLNVEFVIVTNCSLKITNLLVRMEIGFDVELAEEAEEDDGLYDDTVGKKDWVVALVPNQLKNPR
jgi:hypothetical protein